MEEIKVGDIMVGNWVGREDSFIAGGRFVLSKWQEENRWRKVEEEMLKVKSELYFIVAQCKTSYQIIRICDFGAGVPHQIEYFGVIEWKPIEQ